MEVDVSISDRKPTESSKNIWDLDFSVLEKKIKKSPIRLGNSSENPEEQIIT